MSITTETIKIEGMSCNHCVASVTNALNQTEGVTVESVEIGQAKISFDPTNVKEQTVTAAIEDVGFEVLKV